MKIINETRKALSALILFALLAGIAYPLGLCVIGKKLFPFQAEGSLLKQGNQIIGSSLIGQSFTSAAYFHPRPSAVGYDAMTSGASDIPPNSPEFAAVIKKRLASIVHQDAKLVPVDMITASASGLDPHISVDGALMQIHRVASARHLDEKQLWQFVMHHIDYPIFGILGTAHINVLLLNQDLDRTTGIPHHAK